MFKPKFEIGDKVIVVKKNNDNFGYMGIIHCREKVEWRYIDYLGNDKWKSKMRYTVFFEEKGVVTHCADFYADDLKFADLHTLGEHCEKEMHTHKFKINDSVLEDTKISNNEFDSVNEAPLKVCKYCGESFDEEIIESSEEPGACEYCVGQRKKMPKIHMRKSIVVDLKDFSIYGKDGDWLEVTEWTNGEGIDIDIHYDSDHEEDIRNFKLSYDELGIIMNIVNKFGYLPTIYTAEEKEN